MAGADDTGGSIADRRPAGPSCQPSRTASGLALRCGGRFNALDQFEQVVGFGIALRRLQVEERGPHADEGVAFDASAFIFWPSGDDTPGNQQVARFVCVLIAAPVDVLGVGGRSINNETHDVDQPTARPLHVHRRYPHVQSFGCGGPCVRSIVADVNGSASRDDCPSVAQPCRCLAHGSGFRATCGYRTRAHCAGSARRRECRTSRPRGHRPRPTGRHPNPIARLDGALARERLRLVGPRRLGVDDLDRAPRMMAAMTSFQSDATNLRR